MVSDTVAYAFRPRVDPNGVVIDFVLEQRAALTLGGHLASGTLLDAHVSTELPATGLVGHLPFVLVTHLGGDTDRFSSLLDVEIGVFADRYSIARNLALGLEARLLGYPFRVSSGGRSVLVDRVAVPVPFVEIEWLKDSPVRRFQATIQISIRR